MDLDDKMALLATATQTLIDESRRASRRQLPAPTFDGTGDVRAFTQQFMRIAELNGWGQEETDIRLRHVVSGEAAKGLSNCRTAAELVERLHVRFQLEENGATQLLKNSRWNAGEDLYEFTDYLRKLVVVAHPELDNGQVELRTRKELVEAIPRSMQTVHWELKQRPRNTTEGVIEVVRQFQDMAVPAKVH